MYEKLPEQLKKDGRFCLWKYKERNGRMTKVPYQTNGRKASSADKNTFSDFRLAVNAMDGYDGIGMGAFDDFCMVDIDHCVFGVEEYQSEIVKKKSVAKLKSENVCFRVKLLILRGMN